MAKPKLNIIRPQLGFNQFPDLDLIQRLHLVLDGMSGHALLFPNSPVDLATFKGEVDTFTAAANAAVEGGKAQVVLRDKLRRDVIINLRSLAHYVESVCKDDMTSFVASGFQAAAASRNPSQPVGKTSILSADHGISGQLVITMKNIRGARIYQIQYAQVPAAGATPVFEIVTAAGTKPATAISNLTPGTTYIFQARTYAKLGFSEWSDPVTRMCT